MSKRQQRMLALAGLVVGLGVAAFLGLGAFRENLMYFYTPSDVVSGKAPAHARLRLGGLVEKGSVHRGEGLRVDFTLADCSQRVAVSYEGILPDLFREGQGIVATGQVDAGGRFVAEEVLAKHDENYMPPELAESLKTETGHSCAPFKPMMQAQVAS
jgi:cytochrome c-type biogenesis protein CcmE